MATNSMDIIDCIYCNALISFTGMPARRYSDHLRNEHNILVPEEREFSISRTLKKRFEKTKNEFGKSMGARVKLLSFSESSRIFGNQENILQGPRGVSSRMTDKENVIQDAEESDDNLDYVAEDGEKNNNDPLTFEMEDENRNSCFSLADKEKTNNAVVNSTVETCQDSVEWKSGEETSSGSVDADITNEYVKRVNVDEDGNPGDVSNAECSVKIKKTTKKKGRTIAKGRSKTRPREEDEDLHLPWYEAKAHKCRLCEVTVFLGSVDRHLHILHHDDIVHYQQLFPDEDLSIPSWQCGICGEEVSWIHSSIKSHLETGHDQDLNDYYFENILKRPNIKTEDESEELSSAEPSPKETRVTGKRKVSESSVKEEVKIVKTEIDEYKAEFPLPWYESSYHNCRLCGETFSHGYFCKYHVKNKHGINPSQYFSLHPEAKVKLPDWICNICQNLYMWTSDSIYRHLLNSHKMSKAEYEERYIKPGNDSKITHGDGMEEEESNNNNNVEEEIVLPGLPQTVSVTEGSSVKKVLNPFHHSGDDEETIEETSLVKIENIKEEEIEYHVVIKEEADSFDEE